MDKGEQYSLLYKQMMASLMEIFQVAMLIDLNENTLEIYNSSHPEREVFVTRTDANKTMELASKRNIIPLQVQDAIQFTDLTTIGDRLKNAGKYLVKEFISVKTGWVRLCFLPVEENEEKEITKVVFTVQEIEHTEDWQQRFQNIAETDETTGILNFRAYSRYIVQYAEHGIPDDLVLADVRILPNVLPEDKYDTDEGLFLLRNFASLLVKSMDGMKGALFRIDQHEFIFMLELSSSEREEMRTRLSALNERAEFGIRFTYGVAAQRVLHLNSIDVLLRYAKYEAQEKLTEGMR